MILSPGARAGFALVALLAVSLALPVAMADHTYSHRYIVYGRVVDADHNPVPGLTVDLGYKDFEPEGACANQPNTGTDAWERTDTLRITNERGEFRFCFHTHSLSRRFPGEGVISVQEANLTKDIEFNGLFRVSYVEVVLPTANAGANTDILAQEYTVMGRLWRPSSGDTTLDGVRVFGLTVDETPVNITLDVDGRKYNATTTTNGYGDFAIRVPVAARPTSGTVSIDAAGETFTQSVNADTGASWFYAEYPEKTDPFVQKFLLFGGITLGVVVAGGAGWYGFRKMAERRAEEAAREGSTRKRSR